MADLAQEPIMLKSGYASDGGHDFDFCSKKFKTLPSTIGKTIWAFSLFKWVKF